MKELKFIKFNEEMQRAVDEGRKTQTRRYIDPQPYIDKMGNWVWNGVNFGQNSKGPNIQDIASSISWRILGTEKTGYYPQYGIVGEVNNGVLITDIRVERLQDISEEDSLKEGIINSRPFGFRYDGINQFETAKDAFEGLWQSIYQNHPTKAWELNPWVWVIEFEKVKS